MLIGFFLFCLSLGFFVSRFRPLSRFRSSLRLTYMAAARGSLVAAEPQFTLWLRSARGPRLVEGRGGRAALPAGRYWLEGWSARMRDVQGHLWEIHRAVDEPSRMLEVLPGGVTTLPLAAPVQVELVIGQSGRDVSFRLRLKGAGQETVGEVRVDGRRLPPPALRIEDAGGRPLVRLHGEDTCGAGCAMTWRAPRELVQPFRAIPETSLGPFRGAAVAFRFRLDGRPVPPRITTLR
jgi:hypothetical protein